MIQVCSGCGTRWNVRDKQRTWCPRCQGALLAPSPEQPAPDPRWGPPAAPQGARPANPQLPRGYRWIAVRPGAGPAQRRRRRVLTPTPRYPANPGWGLNDYMGPAPQAQPTIPAGPSVGIVRSALRVAAIALAVAAVVHAVRYILLVINRNTLLHPVVAGAALWLGVVASVVALAAVIGCAIVLTRWLIARRAAVYAHYRRDDPRRPGALWAGCLMPLVNLAVGAGVRHRVRDHRRGLQPTAQADHRVVVLWVLSTVLSIFSIATSFTSDTQGIADNTVTTIIAYLLAFAVVLACPGVPGFRAQASRPAGQAVGRGRIGAGRRRRRRRNRPLRSEPEARNRRPSAMSSADGALGGHPFVVAHRGASAIAPRAHARRL